MAAATDSFLAAMDRDFEASKRGDETGSIATFQGTRWDGLWKRRGALEDSLRQRAQAAPLTAAFESDSALTRRVLAPALAAARRASERRDSLVTELFGRRLQAEELANLAEFDLEVDAPELGDYARRVSIAVEFRGAAAGCRSCPALTAVGDAWRLVIDRLPDDVESWPDDRGWWTDADSWYRRVAGYSWDVFMSAVYDAAACFR